MVFADLAIFQQRKTRDNDAQKSSERLQMISIPVNLSMSRDKVLELHSLYNSTNYG